MMKHNISIDSGTSIRLHTAGKYCDRDIVITANADSSLARLIDRSITEVSEPNVTTVGDSVFYYCESLTKVNLPNVTDVLDFGFGGCKSLVVINMPMLTRAGAMSFADCNSLMAVDFPRVEILDRTAFGSCTALEIINLPAAITIGDTAFSTCKSLTAIELPNAISIGNRVFNNCSSLTTIELPKIESIGDYAFYDCTSLSSLIIRNTSQVATIGERSFDNTLIASGSGYIYVPDELLEAYKSAPNWSEYADQIRPLHDITNTVKLVKRTLSGDYSDNTIEIIGKYAFAKCVDLENVTFYAAETISDYAFRDCLQLKTAVFHAAKTLGSSIFSGCSSLTTVAFYNPVAISHNIFYSCQKLDTLILYGSDQISTISSSVLNNTLIASGVGYIYVPSALINEYIANSNWSKYSAQFRAIEDYPEICGGDK